jgi:hypothetical protein
VLNRKFLIFGSTNWVEANGFNVSLIMTGMTASGMSSNAASNEKFTEFV